MQFRRKQFLSFLLLLALLSGCAQTDQASVSAPQNDASEASAAAAYPEEPASTEAVEAAEVHIQDEDVALASAPSGILETTASGIKTEQGQNAVVDYSNTQDGYIMVQYTASTGKRLKVQVKGPRTTYTYNLTPQQWEVFPLTDGNGNYQIVVYENVTGTQYATLLSVSTSVSLKDEFAPFLRPNQYVDYSAASQTVAKAAALTSGVTDPLKKVESIYNYVVNNVSYDVQKAATVQSGYLPVLDSVLSSKKGICFDYAALMTGMLRSQGVPCKLVVGYAGQAYHAWISVWTQSGWIDGVIFFDGTAWHRMDPTFDSSSGQGASVMSYIGDGTNYTTKYLY